MKKLGQFVGFCVNILDLEPTIEHVMDPQLVAKFWGFLEAKGNQVGGIFCVCARAMFFAWLAVFFG